MDSRIAGLLYIGLLICFSWGLDFTNDYASNNLAAQPIWILFSVRMVFLQKGFFYRLCWGITAFGIAMNLLAVASNGWHMPVEGLETFDGRHSPLIASTRFPFLCDIIYGASLGDILIMSFGVAAMTMAIHRGLDAIHDVLNEGKLGDSGTGTRQRDSDRRWRGPTVKATSVPPAKAVSSSVRRQRKIDSPVWADASED